MNSKHPEECTPLNPTFTLLNKDVSSNCMLVSGCQPDVADHVVPLRLVREIPNSHKTPNFHPEIATVGVLSARCVCSGQTDTLDP